MLSHVPAASFIVLWQPDLIIGYTSAIAVYLFFTGPGRPLVPGSAPVSLRKKVYFISAVACVYAATGSPLDYLSDNFLFSAHMLEHLILTMAAPPLLLAGVPAWLWRTLLRTRLTRSALLFVTRPAIAMGMFVLYFSLSHYPTVLDLTLQNDVIHFFDHMLLVITGTIMWWPMLKPLPETRGLTPPGEMLYVFVGGTFMLVMFAIITFNFYPIYPFYEHAPRVGSLTVLQDQKLGGILMKLGMTTAYAIMFTRAFYQWVAMERGSETADLLRLSKLLRIGSAGSLGRPSPAVPLAFPSKDATIDPGPEESSDA